MRVKKEKGFTLIEVVVVMAIIAVLVLLVSQGIKMARNMAKESQHRADARTIQVWLEGYYLQNKSYPTNWVGPNGVTICFTEFQAKVQAAGGDIKLVSSPNDYIYYMGSTPCGGGQLWVSPTSIDRTGYFESPPASWGQHYYAIVPVDSKGPTDAEFMFKDKFLGP